MPKLLLFADRKVRLHPCSLIRRQGWPLLHKLLISVFQFMTPFLRHAEMTDSIRVLYKGLLRILLLLLHDFPEFLCDYHLSFCDVIPPSCIQLRNLILSAFPRNMRLPDPFTPNLKVDLLPEIQEAPKISSDFKSVLAQEHILDTLEAFLKSRSPAFLSDVLRPKLLLSATDAYTSGTKYNVPLLNALVLYIGVHGVKLLQNKSQQGGVAQSAPMDVFQHLLTELDTEGLLLFGLNDLWIPGRYHFLNAIANQLRYPNSHTHYFSCVLLFLFTEATEDVAKEQITRFVPLNYFGVTTVFCWNA
jgi:CCR4-NOT transcription complex subunit 1